MPGFCDLCIGMPEHSRHKKAALWRLGYKLREAARLKVKRSAFCPVGHTYGDGFQDTHQGDNVVRLALLLDAGGVLRAQHRDTPPAARRGGQAQRARMSVQ